MGIFRQLVATIADLGNIEIVSNITMCLAGFHEQLTFWLEFTVYFDL